MPECKSSTETEDITDIDFADVELRVLAAMLDGQPTVLPEDSPTGRIPRRRYNAKDYPL